MSEEKKFLDQAGLKQAFELIKSNVKANCVAKVAGKGLSSNDFTDELKTKLENLDVTGEENVIESVKINGTEVVLTDKVLEINSSDIVTADAINAAMGYTPVSADTVDGKIADAKTALEGEIADAKEELQGAIDDAVADIAAINTLKYEVVDELPAIADADKETIYLIKGAREDVDNNVYVEYFVVNGAWEEIGDTQLKLDDYAKTADVEAAVADAKTEVLTEVETNFVKEVEFVDKVTELIATEEIVKIIEEEIHVLTEAEIMAMFEGAPIVMHDDGTYDVVDDVADAIVAAQAGDVVVLVEDVEIDAGTTIQDGVEIDLNGHTLTVRP